MDDIIARRKLSRGNKRKRIEVEDDDASSSEESQGLLEGDGPGSAVSDDSLDDDDPLASDEDNGFQEDSGQSSNDGEQDSEAEEDAVASVDGGSSEEDSDDETQAEKERKAAFFAADVEPADAHSSFLTMNLSRPILKALTSLSFNTPTPIQAATIPVALLGKDVVGNAVTGSGKTAAFIIPALERLLYRDRGKHAAATRCLVLVPTRELAVQCFEVGSKLGLHTDVRLCLVVG